MAEKESLHTTHAWLRDAAEELGVDPQLVQALVGDILDLTAAVAHNGPSRPAAPTTAFIVGLAAGAKGADIQEVRCLIKRVNTMVDNYKK